MDSACGTRGTSVFKPAAFGSPNTGFASLEAEFFRVAPDGPRARASFASFL
jgi:hypothetical protein